MPTNNNRGGSRSGGSNNRGGRPDDRSGGSRSGGRDSQNYRSKDDRQSKGSKSYRDDKPQGDPVRRETLRNAGTGGAELPKWIKEEVSLNTGKLKRDTVLLLLGEASDAFAEGRFPKAYGRLIKAKELSNRTPTIRELLGLTAYRMERWDDALKELRTYRRLAGDTTHMAVEMDCLRALGRNKDVEKTWDLFMELGGRPASNGEIRVVFGSFLLDQEQARRAWSITNPGRLGAEPAEWDLRQWYVAARAAAALGDVQTAKQLVTAIEKHDLAFPGLVELHDEISRAS